MTIPILFVLDSSGSMAGEKIEAVNMALATLKNYYPVDKFDDVKIGVLTFSTGFKWITDGLVSISEYEHKDIVAGGVTDLGSAIEEVGKRFTPGDLLNNLESDISKPVILFMSDGAPSDRWEGRLAETKKNPWISNSVKISIGIGDDVDETVMKKLTNPTLEVKDDSDEEIAVGYVCAQSPQKIFDLLRSIFYYSVQDGYASLEESVLEKTRRIMHEVMIRSSETTISSDDIFGGDFIVNYPAKENVSIYGTVELRRCQITSCSPKNAQDVILKLESKDGWLFVANISELPLFANFTVNPLECRRIPHENNDTFEIFSDPLLYSGILLNVKVDFDEFGYMSITNNSDFDISIIHTVGDQGMYLRQDDYITIGDEIQILKVVKGGKSSNGWNNNDYWD